MANSVEASQRGCLLPGHRPEFHPQFFLAVFFLGDLHQQELLVGRDPEGRHSGFAGGVLIDADGANRAEWGVERFRALVANLIGLNLRLVDQPVLRRNLTALQIGHHPQLQTERIDEAGRQRQGGLIGVMTGVDLTGQPIKA